MSGKMESESSLNIQDGAAFLDAMANANRLHILNILTQGEMSVGNLSETVGLSQSALSQHLAKLRAAKLVRTRREAQTIYYSCMSESVARILGLLTEFFDDAPTTSRQVA